MILLTGATGFVGGHLARRLVSEGRKVKCLVRRPAENLEELGVDLAMGDVTATQSLPAAFEGIDTVIHLVAVIREKGNATFERVNYQGTKNVLAAAQKAGTKRILYMSNLGAGPDPRYPFLYSKWRAEEEVKKSGLDYTVFRSGLIFGPGAGFVDTLVQVVKRSPTGIVKLAPIVVIPGDGKTKFQMIWIGDVTACYSKALDDPNTIGKLIPIGGPEHVTYEEIVDLIIKELGVKRWKLHMPLFMMRPTVSLMERILPDPPVTSTQLAMLAVDNTTDLDTIEKHFGFKPRSLRDEISYIRSM